MRIGGVVSLVVLVLAVSLAPGRPAAAQEEPIVTIGQDTFGNVFAEGDTPTFRLTTSQSQPVDVHWVARDYWGDEVADGDATVPPGGLELAVQVDTVGYYDLIVTAEGAQPAESSFAVVRPVNGGASDDVRFGMQTHFSQGYDRRLVGVLETIGVATVRDSQPWQNIEVCPGTQPGDRPTCDETEDRFNGPVRAYMERLGAAGIEPLTNFGLGNPNYDAGWEDPPPVDTDGDDEPDEDPPPVWRAYTPHTSEGRKAFERYVGRVLDEYEGEVAIDQVGVYNEPNLCRFGDWGDRVDGNWGNGGTANARPGAHRDIARSVDDAVPADVTVVGPDLFAPVQQRRPPCNTRDPWGWRSWLEDYFAAGALEELDAVSLHPYRLSRPPEGLTEDQIEPVRELIERFDTDDDSAPPPIWITEQGWRTEEGRDNAVTEETQAAYLPRTYITAMAAGVERFYWYNLKDHDSGAFGLVRRPLGDAPEFVDNTPKPSLVAYAVMTDQLTGLDWRGQDPNLGQVESHRFGPDQDPVRVMWVPRGRTEVTLRADEPVRVTDIMGGTETHRPDAEGEVTVTLTLDENVRYVHGNVEVIPAG
jgi:hypothetical protein